MVSGIDSRRSGGRSRFPACSSDHRTARVLRRNTNRCPNSRGPLDSDRFHCGIRAFRCSRSGLSTCRRDRSGRPGGRSRKTRRLWCSSVRYRDRHNTRLQMSRFHRDRVLRRQRRRSRCPGRCRPAGRFRTSRRSHRRRSPSRYRLIGNGIARLHRLHSPDNSRKTHRSHPYRRHDPHKQGHTVIRTVSACASFAFWRRWSAAQPEQVRS